MVADIVAENFVVLEPLIAVVKGYAPVTVNRRTMGGPPLLLPGDACLTCTQLPFIHEA